MVRSGKVQQLAGGLSLGIVLALAAAPTTYAAEASPQPGDGIRFTCAPGQLVKIQADMGEYLRQLRVPLRFVRTQFAGAGESLSYTLTTPADDFNTLDFFDRPEFELEDAKVMLPTGAGKHRTVLTVSKKEIVLALLQHGRLTNFTGDACSVEALREHVGIRQNTVAWAEVLEFGWPDGGPAKWNKRFWTRGTPTLGPALHDAVADMFFHQTQYEIGCYTATKMVMLQGVLDYYSRVKKDPRKLKLIESRLREGGEPLVNLEPGRFWDFEKDFDLAELDRPGKLLRAQSDVAPKNFVPGDWAYIRNTDPATADKTGYEGSNAIYLGRNRFDDYYNDHNHFYSYRQKMDEVYQWRNHVFSRSRDGDKARPVLPAELEKLGKTPEDGGQVLSTRLVPYLFGFEPLPAWRFGD